MRAAAYTRVSSEDQVENFSLAAQLQAIRTYAAAHGSDLVTVYEERGRSGKTALRPEFQEMIADAEAHQFDVVIVHKLDRFSRSLLDTLQYLSRLEKAGVGFISVTEQFDFTSPLGRLQMSMMGVLAQWYVDNLATEIKKGKRERARQGGWNGRLSYGYITLTRARAELTRLGEQLKRGAIDQVDYERRAQVLDDLLSQNEGVSPTAALVDPDQAAGVRLAFELYASGGLGFADVADRLNELGFRSNGTGRGPTLWNRDTVRVMLTNRFYVGDASWGGGLRGHQRHHGPVEWIKGNHQPLVGRDLFEAAQQSRTDRAIRSGAQYSWMTRKANIYPLSRLCWCLHCGAPWGSYVNRGLRFYRHKATPDQCDHQPRAVIAEQLEGAIAGVLGAFSVPDDVLEQVLSQLSSDDAAEQANEQAASLTTQLDRLRRLFVLGDIEESEYVARRDQLRERLEAIKLPDMPSGYRIADVAYAITNFGILWRSATLVEQKQLINLLASRIVIDEGQIVEIVPTPALQAIIDVLRSAGRTGIEPHGRSTIIPRSA